MKTKFREIKTVQEYNIYFDKFNTHLMLFTRNILIISTVNTHTQGLTKVHALSVLMNNINA